MNNLVHALQRNAWIPYPKHQADRANDMSENSILALNTLVDSYLAGLHAGQVDVLRKVFHEDSKLHSLNDQGLVTIETRDSWLARVASRQAPLERGEARNDTVESLALFGPTTASALVQCQIGTARFQDVLTLLRTNTGWQIVTKTFRSIS